MRQTEHAQAMVQRFREMVEDAGSSLPTQHYNELQLIIEAGLNSVLFESLGQVADRLNEVASDLRQNADFFDSD